MLCAPHRAGNYAHWSSVQGCRTLLYLRTRESTSQGFHCPAICRDYLITSCMHWYFQYIIPYMHWYMTYEVSTDSDSALSVHIYPLNTPETVSIKSKVTTKLWPCFLCVQRGDLWELFPVLKDITHTHALVHLHAYAYTHTHARTHTRTHLQVDPYTHTHTHTRVQARASHRARVKVLYDISINNDTHHSNKWILY